MKGWQKMKKFATLTITLFAIFALCTSAALAEIGKHKIGGNTLLLYSLGYEGESNDNIYRGAGTNNTTERVAADWINHIKPAVMFDYTIAGRGDIKFGYKGDLAYYNTENLNDWQKHIGAFDLNYRSPAGLLAGLKNVYTDTSDPYSNDADYLNASTEQVKRWLNRLNAKLGYTKLGDKFGVIGYYNYYIQDYENKVRDFSQDYNEHEIGAGGEMAVMTKTFAFLRYHYGTRDYTTEATLVNDSNDSDYTWHRVNGGLGWDSGAKWSGELNLGYAWKNYENEIDSLGSPYEDRNTWIAFTDVNFQATQATSVGGILRRELKETGSNTNEYNVETQIGLDVSHTVIEKVILGMGYAYQENDYNTSTNGIKRDDKVHDFDISADYMIQPWLTAGLEYVFKSRDSTVNEYDYDQNRIFVRLTGGF